MKISNYVTLCLSLLISFTALSAPSESTHDYAFGAQLNLTDQDSMFSRVELNSEVYTQTKSPTLDDVRVFNRNGQVVPFALLDVYSKKQHNQQLAMQLYPLNADNRIDNNTASNHYAISIQGKNVNIVLDDENNAQQQYQYSYLLQIADDIKIERPLTNFKLTFADQPQNWQASATVLYSSDFKYWNQAVSNVPIMALTNSDNSKLTLMDINFPSYARHKSRIWLITISSANPLPELINVTALSKDTQVNNAFYAINLTLQSSDQQNAIYTLPASIPLNELTIELNSLRSVLPVNIFYKTNAADQNWLKLEDRILRKIDDYDLPTHINLDNRHVAAIKITTINSSFEQAPTLIAYRNKVDLVFNSANNAPFILAWGSANPKSAALPTTSLLSANDSIDSLPLAFIGSPVKLAGEQALISHDAPASASLPKWLIWLGLVFGAGVLVVLALKLFKEIKKQD